MDDPERSWRRNPTHRLLEKGTLTMEDLAVLVTKLKEIAGKWRTLGVQLKFLPGDLNCFPPATQADPIQALQELLTHWLQRMDPPPTLEALAEAVGGPVIANELLARTLLEQREDFPSSQARQAVVSGSDISTSTYSDDTAGQSESPEAFCCPCGECSFDSFLLIGCPNLPHHSFPYLDTHKLNEAQKKDLKFKLHRDTMNIKDKFSSVLSKTSRSLRKQDIPHKQLIICVIPLAYDHIEEITQATSIEDVVIILCKHQCLSFLKYDILRRIIGEFPGADEDHLKDHLEKYVSDFKVFSKRSVFEVPLWGFSSKEAKGTKFAVKLDETAKTLEDVLQVEQTIAEVLEMRLSSLHICSVEKGCVMVNFVVCGQRKFPPSSEQLAALAKASVQYLECDGEKYIPQVSTTAVSLSKMVDARVTSRFELNNITRHCLLHAVHALSPNGIHTVLPASGSRKIEDFCTELQNVLLTSKSPRRKTVVLPGTSLIQSLDIQKFYSGASSVADFAMLIERRLIVESDGDIDIEALHMMCWRYYESEKKNEITYPKWLSPTCTYRLWLIFNCVQERGLSIMLLKQTMNEVLKRLLELTGYSWNDSYRYGKQEEVEFPTYVEVITDYFDRLHLETSLTCEVIADMVDEIVDGVLKKGYLTKKGHKVKNYKRRWFVLQRTILRYYTSREKLTLKGQLVLNGRTEVRSLPDKGARQYRFEVTCGHTGVPFMMCTDDQKMKHEWMLAIRKAIALAKLIEGGDVSRKDDFTATLAGFYLLKYGTDAPRLVRQDSDIKHMRHHTTARVYRKIAEVEKEKHEDLGTVQEEVEDSDDDGGPTEEYVEMQLGNYEEENINSSGNSFDEDGYLKMDPAKRFSAELEEDVTQSAFYPSHERHPLSLLNKSPSADDLLNLTESRYSEEGICSEGTTPITPPPLYDKCDPSTVRYYASPPPEDSYLPFTSKKRSQTDLVSSPLSLEDCEGINLLDITSESLQDRRPSSPNKYLTLLPLDNPHLPLKRPRSPIREGKSPSPDLDEIPRPISPRIPRSDQGRPLTYHDPPNVILEPRSEPVDGDEPPPPLPRRALQTRESNTALGRNHKDLSPPPMPLSRNHEDPPPIPLRSTRLATAPEQTLMKRGVRRFIYDPNAPLIPPHT